MRTEQQHNERKREIMEKCLNLYEWIALGNKDIKILTSDNADGSGAVYTEPGNLDKLEFARYVNIISPHNHCVCGGKSNDGHESHTDTEWQPWIKTDSLPTEAGNYYLVTDVSVKSDQVLRGDVNLCLNGSTVSVADDASFEWDGKLLSMDPDATSPITFTLTDCIGGGMIDGSTMKQHGATWNHTAYLVSENQFIMRGSSTVKGEVFLVQKAKLRMFDNSAVRNDNGPSLYDDAAVIMSGNASVTNLYLSDSSRAQMSGSAKAGKIVTEKDAVLSMTDKAEVDELVWTWIYDDGLITLSGSAKVKDYLRLHDINFPVNAKLIINDKAEIAGDLVIDCRTPEKVKLTLSGDHVSIGGSLDISAGGIWENLTVEAETQVRVGSGINMPDVPMNGRFVCDGEITDGIFYGEVENNGKITGGIFYGIVTGSGTIEDSAKRTVTFDPNGGSAVNAQKILRGQKAAEPSGCKKTGHTFAGWNTGASQYDFSAPVLNDITLTAQWSINQYTITFDTTGGSSIAPITQDYGTDITAPADPTREGYTFNGWNKTIPTTMPAENMTITAQWKDIEEPTGKIRVATKVWEKFLNNITFGLFFKETQTVTVTADDNSGETVKIEYWLSSKALTKAELANAAFTVYTAPFSMNPDNEYIIYVRLTDTAGNTTYICSEEGIVLDATKPVIKGIENGGIYCAAQTVTIDEKYIGTVTVNSTEVTLDENNSFTLAPADGEQKIIVTDKAGNSTEMTVTVNAGHTFGAWASNGDGTHTRKCAVDGCTGLETQDCAGGKATCTEKAVCETCGKAYGGINANNHTNLRHIPAKAATRDAEGNTEYWYCDGCDRYYGDAAATGLITKADTVTEKLPDESKSPQTAGQNSLVLWIALLFISGGVLAGAVTAKKQQKSSLPPK